MSKPKTAAEMVDRYLQAIQFWLPKGAQQEGLLAEFGEDLRSQIDDKETELGRPLTLDEASAILKRSGSPMMVAGTFSPKQYLIGPALFPIYKFVLKMVLFWILIPVFAFIVGPTNVANANGNWPGAIFATIGNLWSGLFIAAGIITLVFVVLERTQPGLGREAKWDPIKLPPVENAEKKPSMMKMVTHLIFAALGLMWLLLLPAYPFLILGPAAAFLKASPLMHRFYDPLVALAVISVLRFALAVARPQWAWYPPVSELGQAALTLIMLHFLLNASGQMTNGEWHPFVVLADSARNSTQYIKVAAIVNVSILLSLAGTWIGLCIAVPINIWQLLRSFRERRLRPNTASLQLQ